jgi:uncharacterized protein YihD (DUF1040 family)
MRDPDRIERVIGLVKKVWYNHPDLRLTQLIMNILKFSGDPYYIEDNELEEAFKKFCKDRGI